MHYDLFLNEYSEVSNKFRFGIFYPAPSLDISEYLQTVNSSACISTVVDTSLYTVVEKMYGFKCMFK